MFLDVFSLKQRLPSVRSDEYATCADFCKAFNDSMDRLYMLALRLTGTPEMAERCFLSAFESCLGGKTAFRESAQSWARRTMIRAAIRIVFASEIPASNHFQAEPVVGRVTGEGDLIAVMSNLEPFDRFVYTLSVLERISVHECALLLNSSVHEVMDARARALQSTGNLHRQKHANEKRRIIRTFAHNAHSLVS